MPPFRLGNQVEHGRHTRIEADIQATRTQLALYQSMNGFYPTTDQGLDALVVMPQSDPKPARWYPFYSKQPKDPWLRDYIYRCPGVKNPSQFDLFSGGPDGNADTADDDWGQ
jgi:general secretion pathway protein G